MICDMFKMIDSAKAEVYGTMTNSQSDPDDGLEIVTHDASGPHSPVFRYVIMLEFPSDMLE